MGWLFEDEKHGLVSEINKQGFERLDIEGVNYYLFRLSVPGGWLIYLDEGVCFYPDETHKWNPINPPNAPGGK